jgi:hypothetical protein
MDTENNVLLYFAFIFAVGLVTWEIRLRIRLKNWIRSKGKIVGGSRIGIEDDIRYCPIVAYNFKGEEREQICESNLCHYKQGETVSILINPVSGKVFVATHQDRWFTSTFLLGCIAILLYLYHASD